MQTTLAAPETGPDEEYFSGCTPVSLELNLALHQADEYVRIRLGGIALDATKTPQPEELPLTNSELDIFYGFYYGVCRDFTIYEPSFSSLFQAIKGTLIQELLLEADDQAIAEHTRLNPHRGLGSDTGYQWSGSGRAEGMAPLLDMALVVAQLLRLRSQTRYEQTHNRFSTVIRTQPTQIFARRPPLPKIQDPERSDYYFMSFASLADW